MKHLKPDYPVDTLGHYYYQSVLLFGPTSPATLWLITKADAATNGFDALVIQDDTQMLFLLNQIDKKGTVP